MPDDNLAIVLNQELAAQMATPQFTELMQKISAYEVQSTNVQVTNDAEYQMAADSLVAVAEASKSLETMRVTIVAYPNTFVKAVNATFKTLKLKCENIRGRLEHHAKKYKTRKDAEFAKQQAELAAAQLQQPAPVVDVDSGAPPVDPTLPTPPMQSTKATNGKGSVSYRAGRANIEVINAAKLVRASLDSRNKVASDVISIDMKALRVNVESGEIKTKQWEKYGVKVTASEEMVVRT